MRSVQVYNLLPLLSLNGILIHTFGGAKWTRAKCSIRAIVYSVIWKINKIYKQADAFRNFPLFWLKLEKLF